MKNKQKQDKTWSKPLKEDLPCRLKKAFDEWYHYFDKRDEALLTGHVILWTIIVILLIAVIWASVAELDEITNAEGKVIPSRQIQVIQNLEGGIVRDILVKEGDHVEKNQILMHIDNTRFQSSFQEAKIQTLALTAKIDRLTAETHEASFVIPTNITNPLQKAYESELALFQSRQEELRNKRSIFENRLQQKQQELAELEARQVQLERGYALVSKELSLTEPLVDQGAVSEVEVLRLKREANVLHGDLQRNKLAIPRIKAGIKEAQDNLSEISLTFQREAQQELNAAKHEFEQISASSVALEDRVKRTAVRSLVKGTVKQINITTIGGVIQPGMDLMEIVPSDDTLLVEARVRPKDIAFLRPGQSAMVKITAYDFSIYGGLEATLEHISADTIQDAKGNSFYKIRIRTKKNSLEGDEPLPIIAGMLATVDIISGQKSVLDYLLKPLIKAKHKALRER